MDGGGGFKFDFGPPEAPPNAEAAPKEFAPCKEISRNRAQGDSQPLELEETQVAPGLSLLKGRVSGEEAAALLKDERVSENDLIPGAYEGGFKLWECALDLSAYLLSKYQLDAKQLVSAGEQTTALTGKKVLELGCGHGLPGIVALMAGADVHFQDYNPQVLEQLTIPNVIANMQRLPPARRRPASKYYSGDWFSVGEHLTANGYGGHFDVILASETIYHLPAQERLLECIKQLLQPPMGVAFVAAKRYYFGVGGGTQSFKKLVESDGLFEVSTVACVDEPGGGGNVREVLRLSFPESIQPYFL